MKRRQFLSIGLKSSGAILLQFHFPAHAAASGISTATAYFANGWLEITHQNQFIFTLDKAEMGQNVITSLTAIFAEELDIDLHRITVQFPTLSHNGNGGSLDESDNNHSNPLYRPTWGTGGSSSVRTMWLPLRHAGAATKSLFIEAASQLWDQPQETLSNKNGVITAEKTKQTITYAQLIPRAAKLKPVKYTLKPVPQFSQLGKPLQRHDAALKATGAANYGIDTQVPNQKLAVIIRGPLGSTNSVATQAANKVKAFDATEALKQPGVTEIINISNGVAVIAATYWQASKAAKLVQLQWQSSETVSTLSLHKQLVQELANEATTARIKGDAETVLSNTEQTFQATYSVPLLAHAPMEPMNCTVWFHDNICEIWAPTQRPLRAQTTAQLVCGYNIDQIKVHTSFIGGGFGRRLSQDYVREAVEIAQHVDYPVKLVWSREDDMQHGVFRPAVTSRITASLSDDGIISAWDNRIASLSNKAVSKTKRQPSIKEQLLDLLRQAKYRWNGEAYITNAAVEGADNVPYSSDNIRVAFNELPTPIPIGAWRSIGHSYNAFFVESFIDELAHYAKQDPIDFRLKVFDTKQQRLAHTLRIAAEFADWKNTPKGRFKGVACHSCFGSHVTQIIEISIEQNKPKLETIYCVADCGFVVDPDGVRAQLEGAIIFGLSAALHGKITIEEGHVMQSNFHNYRVLRIDELPDIQIKLINSSHSPSGAGEIGTPPVAPALANAWFTATNNRVRDLPLLN